MDESPSAKWAKQSAGTARAAHRRPDGRLHRADGQGLRQDPLRLHRRHLGTGSDDDLQVTTDYRNVFGEIVARRFPDRSLAEVFPGLSYSPVGLMS
jgi:hypothetical protein